MKFWLRLRTVKLIVGLVVSLLLLVFGCLEVQPLYAQAAQPRLVKDINSTTLTSDAESFVEANGLLFFVADDGVHGRELWRTDGSLAGTMLVKDILPGAQQDEPTIIGSFHGELFFGVTTFEPQAKYSLWKSDGTAGGTIQVKELPGSVYTGSVEVGNFLYFTVSNILEMWRTDGTAAGTIPFSEADPALANLNPSIPSLVNGALLFWAKGDLGNRDSLWRLDQTGASLVKQIPLDPGPINPALFVNPIVVNNHLLFGIGNDLWSSDGTTAGTKLLQAKAFDYPWQIIPGTPDRFYSFVQTVDETNTSRLTLWQSDGTTAGTKLIKEIQPTQAAISLVIDKVTTANNELIFVVGSHNSSTSCEIWKSDGTAVNTGLLKATCPDVGFTVVANKVYFSALNEQDKLSLWRSDGTPAGTAPIKAFDLGTSLDELVDVNGVLYTIARRWLDLTSSRPIAENQLWKSDGTTNGTTLVKQIDADWNLALSSIHYYLTVYQGDLYFRAFTNDTDIEIWRSDGTAQGTHLLKDINSARTANAYPDLLTAVGDDLYFDAVTTAEGGETWKASGRPVQASLLKETRPGPEPSGFTQMVGVNGTLFGLIDYDKQLWKSNGDASNTVLVKQYLPADASAYAGELTAVGNLAYFLIKEFSPDTGVTLWVSDGTEAGTQPLRKLASNANLVPPPGNLIGMNGSLYFGAEAADGNSYALWKSSGTVSTTVELKKIRLNDTDQKEFRPVVLNNVLYFVGDDGTNIGLWKSDGTPAGTVLVKQFRTTNSSFPWALAVVGNQLFFGAADDQGSGVWKSDGTPNGTVLVSRKVAPDSKSLATAAKGIYYFIGNDGLHGPELWKSDGTDGGTQLVTDRQPDSDYDTPFSLTAFNGLVYFFFSQLLQPSGVASTQLWQSDGTEQGTTSVMEVRGPYNNSQLPFEPVMAVVKDRLFFTAQTTAYGSEVWMLDPNPGALHANDDAYTVAEDTRLTISAVGLLANDNGNPLTATLQTQATHGALDLRADGSFAYVPSPDFNGVDHFTYRVDNSGLPTATASVAITVTPVNDPPVAVDDLFTTTLGVGITADVVANDHDIEHDPLLITAIVTPSHGTAVLFENQVHYVPAAGFQGTDHFTYTVSDGSATSLAQVTIHVLSAPDTDSDGLLDVVECSGSPNCPDADGDQKSNAHDIDSDGDGIPDLTESQMLAIFASTTLTTPLDSDGDQTPDYLDTDSDNDGILDAIEGHDANHDGQADVTPTGQDSDGDGLDNAYDTVVAPAAGNASGATVALSDSDGDHLLNWRDNDDDGDGILTKTEGSGDANQNGVPDYLEVPTSAPNLNLFLPNVRR